MNSTSSLSPIDSEIAHGESAENIIMETNNNETFGSSRFLVWGIIRTPCIDVLKGVQRLILTSMEHCSYKYIKYTHKRVPFLLLVMILISHNSSAGSFNSDTLMDFEILEIKSHDNDSFTQGLEIKDNSFFESTGLYGHSRLREINITSGEIVNEIGFDIDIFAEGITIVGDSIIMLTYKENYAMVFDINTFDIIGNYNYDGEGWGICNNEDSFIMSNGSSELAFRDIDDFSLLYSVIVKENEKEIININELECVGNSVYANIWGENRIISINMSTGLVEFSIYLDSLSFNKKDFNGVLNGIAYSESDDAFWITGKNWSNIYLTKFIFTNNNDSNPIDNNSETMKSEFLDSKLFSSILLIAITIFVLPGSWPMFILLFIRSFMRQSEHPPALGENKGGDDSS